MDHTKEKKSLLTGETAVIFSIGEKRNGVLNEFGKVTATPGGVTFEGQIGVMSYEDLQAFAAIIGDAWKAHMSLKTKIIPANQMELPL